MKTLLTYLILIFAVQYSYSQIEPEWVLRHEGQYSPDVGNDIAVDNSGNIYVTGQIVTQTTSADFITIKYNSAGVEQWVKTYNGTGNWADIPVAITIDKNNNVYVTGSSMSNSWNSYERDYLTIRYNSDGVQQWTKRYNGPGDYTDDPKAITTDNAGNVIVTGFSSRFDSSLNIYQIDYATIKYSTNGDEVWVKRYQSQYGGSQAYGVIVDKYDNIYVTGGSSGGQSYDYLTLKYSPNGDLIWIRSYNGLYSGVDQAIAIGTDTAGFVYVTGESQESETLTTITTIKYNSSGAEQWIRKLPLPPNYNQVVPHKMKISEEGNIFITGITLPNPNNAFITLKYNTEGELLWVKTHPNASNSGYGSFKNSVDFDPSGNVYVAGSKLYDIATIKYDANGNEQWVHTYNGPANNQDKAVSIAIDQNGNVYVTGFSQGVGTGYDITTIKYPGASEVYEPALNDKWIAGETDTIRWTETGWLTVNIKCILNFETPIEEEIVLAEGYPVVDSEFEWEIPDALLSYRSKIIVENANNLVEKMESDIFRIKPYVLTRITEDSTYYEYRKDRDQWGFVNDSSSIWPDTWFNQFYYLGIDPYTQLFYPIYIVDSLFLKAKPFHHPDWLSWVRTFGISDCYANVGSGIYWQIALVRWRAVKKNAWEGSCFGIAAANAIAFSHRTEFTQAFPTFPAFVNPVSVVSDDGVKFVVNELFTHQYGNPTQANDPSALAKTPIQTLEEIRQMLLEDTAKVKTLSIYNNGGSGGHTILAYGLKKDPVQKNLFYIQVYDNSNPTSNNPITIDTSANGGTGNWSTPDWAGWGGNGKIHLEIPSIQYLNGATFPARPLVGLSAFILPENVLEINYPNNTPIRIIDNMENITGYVNNIALNEIPGSMPMILKNGSESPPYGYSLPKDNYSVVLNEFEEDIVETFFFTGNKSFVYERSGAEQTQTDRLFFDGGVSVSNPDAQTKTVKLLNLLNETTQEKLSVIRSIELAHNDSVKIENPDSNKVKLISYGSAKDYDIELNYVTENGLGRFGDFNIPLSANTSHTFVPEWSNLTNSQLVVLVDIGNNGTIDDTLYINNTVDVDEQGSLLLPDHYNLAQNYPNPFNPVTTIQYSIPQRSSVMLKVYDVLGNEIVTLVNEEKDRGVYSVNFDASNLASGIYLYRLQVGDPSISSGQGFVETKKMILLK